MAGHLRNDVGEAIGTEGFYVDVTRSTDEHQTTITEAVAEIAKHRSTIEQAKGVLMVVYGIDADAAFEILKWRSQESNIKLRLLAETANVTVSVAPIRRSSTTAVNLRPHAYDRRIARGERRAVVLH